MPVPAILIATLGSEPQVVTACLDLLLRKGEQIQSVIVLHTDPRPEGVIGRAVASLTSDFVLNGTPFTLIPLCTSQGIVLADIDIPESVASAFRTLYKQVHRAKQSGFRVHLSLAGGRKIFSSYAMLTAQLLFDDHDHLWHLHSSGDFLKNKQLHPDLQDEVHLIEIPVLVHSPVSLVWGALRQVDDPFDALEQIRKLGLEQRQQMARTFYEKKLTSGERRVVGYLVREGLSDQDLGTRLGLSPRTIEQHLRKAYFKATEFWELDAPVDRTQLVSLLSIYCTLSPEYTGNHA